MGGAMDMSFGKKEFAAREPPTLRYVIINLIV